MTGEQKTPISLNPVFHYVNNAQIAYREEEFLFAFTSGNQIIQFVFSPKHAKRFKLLLERNLTEYEKKFNELKTSLPEFQKKTMDKPAIGFQEK